MSANQVILSKKKLYFKLTFGSKIDFSASKIDFNRHFEPKKLAPCKVDSKMSFLKCREV